eukprot:10299732-Alexandrium_andersonii.AAC.1
MGIFDGYASFCSTSRRRSWPRYSARVAWRTLRRRSTGPPPLLRTCALRITPSTWASYWGL